MDKKLYKIIGKSVTGASHKRSKLPNQDYIDCFEGDDGTPELVLAVSDGHGSHKCFRSAKGAQFAVESALDLVKENKVYFTSNVVKSRSAVVEEKIPKLLTARWLQRVGKDREEQPFTAEELNGVEQKGGAKDRGHVTNHPELAYGATLLTVIIGKDVILYLQIGDGDILTVDDNGEVSRPIPPDERIFGNETTSLSLKDAWRDFRSCVQTFDKTVPRLILLATDGYSNSFSTDEGFLKIGRDYLNLIKSMGYEGVKNNIEDWLQRSTQSGSGDDITLGIVYRLEDTSQNRKRFWKYLYERMCKLWKYLNTKRYYN